VKEILHYYSVYQSSRWVGEQLVIRLKRELSSAGLARLNRDFTDLIRIGAITQGPALRPERNEPDIWHLPRLIFTPHRRSFGRLRQLVDAINSDV
jgi:hypothetical protein